MLKLVSLTFLAAYIVPLALLLGPYGFESHFFVLAYTLAGVLVSVIFFAAASQNKVEPIDHTGRFSAPIGAIYVCMIAYVVLKSSSITTLLQGLASGQLAQIMLANALERYHGNSGGPSAAEQLGLLFLFAFFCFVGSRIGLKNGRHILMFWLFALFAFFVESIALARAGMLLALLCFLVELAIRKNILFARASLLTYAKIAVPALLLLFGVYLFSAYFRVSHLDNGLQIAFEKLGLYTIASHDLFLIWLEKSFQTDVTGGFNTFTFLWKLTGTDVEQGFYQPLHSRFGFGNIYLNIRGFIQDFGGAGACLFLAILMLIVGYCTFVPLNGLSYILLRVALAILLFPIYSPFFFTTFAIGFLFSGFALVALSVMRKQREPGFLSERVATIQ